jgi:hypothetical protein
MTVLRRGSATIVGLILATGALTGCSSSAADESAPTPGMPSAASAAPSAPSADPSGGGGIALGGDELPPGWPDGLPAYEGGTLISAVVSDDGLNVNAAWNTDATPEVAWADMDAALRAEGFVTVGEAGQPSMLVEDESMKSDNYVREGFEVNLVVVPGVQTGVLLNASKA